METQLLKKITSYCFFFLFTIAGTSMNAQCSIIGNRNASSYTCTGPTPSAFLVGCSTVTVGDGSTPTVLTMNVNLDLKCLGPIQFIIKNQATLDFSAGNFDLQLAAGSSIIVESGGQLSAGSNCSAADLITIGSTKVASCNGGGGAATNFTTVVASGGFNTVQASVSPACGPSVFSIAVSVSPAPTNSTVYNLYSAPSGGSPLSTATATTSPYNATLTTPSTSVSTTYYISATTGSVTTPRRAVTVVVNAIPASPTVGTVTQPNCVITTGSIALSGLPATGTWTIIANPATAGLTGLSGSGTTTTIGGLVQGQSYNFAVFNGSCTSPVTSSILMNPVLTSTFNGSTWSNPPAPGNIGVITAGNASPIYLNANVELCSCTISANTNLVVNPGFTLKIVDRIQVNTAGSLTFENNASLVQVNNTALNSGVINYKRQTSVIRRGSDYTYWSSPVSNQSLLAVSPNTNSSRFWSFNTVSSWFVESPSSSMVVGKGYIIRAPEFFPGPNPPSSVHQATFIGPPNNGVITIPAGGPGSFNLIGNPYPSAIDAVKFLNTNAAILGGTIYFWTHNTEIRNKVGAANEGSGDLVYIQDDYASFNLTGGVATALPAPSETDLSRTPNGFIAAGQSFFTTSRAASGSLVTFNNDMRLGAGSALLNNSQFFKTKGTEKGSANVDRNRIWLNLTNKQNAFKQTLIGYIDGATNDFDSAFDGPSFNANAIINFYSVNNAANYVIQGRALPFEQNDLVPLGYSSTVEGEFAISIDNLDGLFTTQNVFLEDKNTNMIHNLKTSPYSFQTTKGTFNDRFVLRYTDKTLGVEDVIADGNKVLVTVKNKQLKVTAGKEDIKSVVIYSILGKQIYFKKDIISKELVIDNLPSGDQVLIVKTVLEDGTLHTTKTIFK